jgi:hypothetical protein
VLGPVRPFFLAFLAMLNLFTGATLRQSSYRYAIAMMPEGVFFLNQILKGHWHHRTMQNLSPDNNARIRAKVLVDIPSMGCTACINKIESSLRSTALSSKNQVIGASSWLESDRKGGSAQVDFYADSQDDVDAFVQAIVDVIKGAGFEGSTIANIKTYLVDSSGSGGGDAH